jgi:hypothetical protein
MSSRTSRYNQMVKEETKKVLSELYESENNGKGTKIQIRKYLGSGIEHDGIVEKILKKNENFEVFFRTIEHESGYKTVTGHYENDGYFNTKEFYINYFWNEPSEKVLSIKNPRKFSKHYSQ